MVFPLFHTASCWCSGTGHEPLKFLKTDSLGKSWVFVVRKSDVGTIIYDGGSLKKWGENSSGFTLNIYVLHESYTFKKVEF